MRVDSEIDLGLLTVMNTQVDRGYNPCVLLCQKRVVIAIGNTVKMGFAGSCGPKGDDPQLYSKFGRYCAPHPSKYPEVYTRASGTAAPFKETNEDFVASSG